MTRFFAALVAFSHVTMSSTVVVQGYGRSCVCAMTVSASLVTVSSEHTQSHRSPSVCLSAVNSRSQSGNVCSIRAKDGTVTKIVFAGNASAIQNPVKLLPVAQGMMILPRALFGLLKYSLALAIACCWCANG